MGERRDDIDVSGGDGLHRSGAGARVRRMCPSVLVVLLGAMAACTGPDRSEAAEELRRELGALPGVAEASVWYAKQSLETSESVRYIVTVDPAAGPAAACGVLPVFIEGFAGTGIDAGQARLELRDVGTPPLAWTYEVQPDAVAATAEHDCVVSQEVRGVPLAYGAVVVARRDAASRPLIRLRFRGGEGVATPEEGDALARAHVASYLEFDWDVLIICGDEVCEGGS